MLQQAASLGGEFIRLTTKEASKTIDSKKSSLLMITPRGILTYSLLTAVLLQFVSVFYLSGYLPCGGAAETTDSLMLLSPPSSSNQQQEPNNNFNPRPLKSTTYFGPVQPFSQSSSSSSSRLSCCERPDCSECQRVFLSAHKMGHDIQKNIQSTFFPHDTLFSHPAPFTDEFTQPSTATATTTASSSSSSTTGSGSSSSSSSSSSGDFRHILLTRNFYDTILDGYILHKGGRECFDPTTGQPLTGTAAGWLYNAGDAWERNIVRTTRRHDMPWPEGRGRDMCTYLKEESERDGIRVYVEWIYIASLRNLVAGSKTRRDWEVAAGHQQTLHVCYEDMVQQQQQGDTYATRVKEMSQFLYPYKTPLEESDISKNVVNVYQDPDAANVSSKERQRLRAIVAEMDRELFGGLIAFHSNDFGCGPRD